MCFENTVQEIVTTKNRRDCVRRRKGGLLQVKKEKEDWERETLEGKEEERGTDDELVWGTRNLISLSPSQV